MSELDIQVCPETGICSIIRPDGSKIDLMPDEVGQIRDAAGSPDAIRQAISAVDAGFADKLDSKDLAKVSVELK